MAPGKDKQQLFDHKNNKYLGKYATFNAISMQRQYWH